jgi:hypothetical protein
MFDAETRSFVMVMEDITARGGDPRYATRPLTVEQVQNGVRSLAALHGRYWGDALEHDQSLGGSSRMRSGK